MKKIAFTILALAALVSCREVLTDNGSPVTESAVFSATIEEDDSKATIDYSPTAAKIFWESGDKIVIKDVATNDEGIYTVSSGAGTNSATFTYVSGTNHSGTGTYTASFGETPGTRQTYSGAAPSRANVYMTSSTPAAKDKLSFSAQCGVLRLSLQTDQHKIMRVELSTDTETFRLDMKSPVDISSEKVFYWALPAGTYKKIAIYDNANCCASKTLSPALDIAKGHLKPASSTSLAFDFGTKGFNGIQEWVQLWNGGPLWAAANMGADDEKDAGHYFAWGYYAACVRNNLDTGWALANNPTSSKPFTITSFPNLTAATFTDAAAYIMGPKWSVPTKNDMRTLVNANSSNLVDVTYDASVHLIRISGKDGSYNSGVDYTDNCIVLPASGRGKAADLQGMGSQGHYWTRTEDSEEEAVELNFTMSSATTKLEYKYMGNNIRPVMSLDRSPIEYSVDIINWESTTFPAYYATDWVAAVSSTTPKTLSNLSSFDILGYYNSGSSTSIRYSATANKNGSVFETSESHYWHPEVPAEPAPQSMSFYAASGHSIDNTVCDFYSSPKKFPGFDFTMTDPGSQEDILVAECTFIPKIGSVPLVFNHALAQVDIKVAGKNYGRKVKYTVLSATLGLWPSNNATEPGDHKHQIVRKGTYTFGNGIFFKSDVGYSWDLDYTDKTGYDIDIASSWSSGKTIAANTSPSFSSLMSDGSYFVLPQFFKSMLLAITFKAEVYNAAGTSVESTFQGTKYVDVASNTMYIWQCGKKYEYSVILSPSGTGDTAPAPYGPTPTDPSDPSKAHPENPDQSAPTNHDPDVPVINTAPEA